MPFMIVRNDITKMQCDAIVNAANTRLASGGGVCGAIHAAAGPELEAACAALGGCATGKAKITPGYRLPARYVIHAVGPRWIDGSHGEPELLASCYRDALALAKAYSCESVAFPLISAGIFGYPRDQALQVAVSEVSAFLMHHEMRVYLVVYDRQSFQISARLQQDVAEYIDEQYVAAHFIPRERNVELSMPMPAAYGVAAPSAGAPVSLEEMLRQTDESFSQMLLRKIDEKGMTDAQCYKKANIDRKLFSKIRGDIHYRPSKATALAFAVALELSLEETRELLERAGFALSHASKFDIIIEYFIRTKNYNIFEINETLFAFDQNLLGTG